MTDLPSSWPLRYKLLAVALFVGAMAVWALVWTGVVKSLPVWVLGYLATGGIGAAIGLIVGERITINQLRRSGQIQERWDTDTAP